MSLVIPDWIRALDPGLQVSDNGLGFTAVRLHYSAAEDKRIAHPDPALAQKAQEWLDAQRKSWPDPNDFEREYELSFWVGKGRRVFPQFTQTMHCRPIDAHKRRVVSRGWDFGWHAPVCVFAQIDHQDRLLVLKEIVGKQQTTREFAQDVIARSAEWFPQHAPGFEDFCDPAGQHVQTLDSEKNERRDVDVLQGLGIHPRYEWGWSRKDGRSLVHQLLAMRSDGTPGLWLDMAGCPITAQAFLGRYVYVEAKTTGKIAEEPDDVTHPYADVMAALRYLVIGLHGRLAMGRFRASSLAQSRQPAPAAHVGYGTVRRA